MEGWSVLLGVSVGSGKGLPEYFSTNVLAPA